MQNWLSSLRFRCLLMALCSIGFAVRTQAQNVNLQVWLVSASNDYMTAEDHALANLKVVTDGRWVELYRYPTNWLTAGPVGIHESAGAYVFYANRLPDFYQTPPCITSVIDGVTLAPILIYQPYSNSLTIAVSGQPAGSNVPWSLTAYPAEFTNSSAFTTAGTNTATLSPIPTGTYSVAFPASFKGRTSPAGSNIQVLASRVSTSSFAYVAYTNAISVTVTGITATTNAAWSLTGPAAFTNAETYATSFSNVFLLTAIPTGSYTVTFPYVPGYITPDPIAPEVTHAAQTNFCTGTYVAVTWGPYTNATDTNPPVGTVPTNFPPATNPGTVMAWSNGVLATPTNFFHANSQQIAQAAAAGGALENEVDPVWSAVSNSVLTSIGSLTASVSVLEGAILDVQARTTVWDQASADAATATASVSVLTASVSVLQARTTVWDQASADAATATASVSVLEASVSVLQARTTAWDQASADASSATTSVFVLSSSVSVLQGATNNLNTRVSALELDPSAPKTFLSAFLDIDPLGQDAYTDFEIKFSTNNFTNLVYWYRSWAPNTSQHFGYSVDDPDPYVFYTLAGGHTDGNSDARFWHKQTPHASIFSTMADPTNGVVGGLEFWPSHACDYPASWMSETNECLVGSWCRWTPTVPETNAVGATIWRPVTMHWALERRTR